MISLTDIENDIRISVVEASYFLPGFDMKLFDPPDLDSDLLSSRFPCRFLIPSMFANPFLKLRIEGDDGGSRSLVRNKI
jgi:hypothetical protein